MKTPQEIVDLMLENDKFSKWMNVSVTEIKKGYCKIECQIHEEMLNGFDILHGGISYSLSDSALAFAANTYGHKAVSIETSITHLSPVFKNDILTIETEELFKGKSLAVYNVSINNQNKVLISRFKGTVSISTKIW